MSRDQRNKNSYECRVYESVDDSSLSYVISRISGYAIIKKWDKEMNNIVINIAFRCTHLKLQ